MLESLLKHTNQFELVHGEYNNPQTKVKITPGLNYKKRKYRPTLSRVLTDLVAVQPGNNPDLVNVADGHRMSSKTPSGVEILASMMTQLGKNEDMETLAPLSIPVSTHGLGASQLCLPSWMKGVTDGWRSALSVPGMVTNVHRDYWLVGQVMQHIQGKKLWLIWPPEEKNIFQQPWPLLNERGVEHITELIETTSNFLVYWCEEPATFTIPPFTLHAVLTFEISTHSGVRVCSTQWMWEIRLVGKVLEKQLGEPPEGDSEKEEWIHWNRCLVREVAEDIRLWGKMDPTVAKKMGSEIGELAKLGRRVLELASLNL